MVPLLFRQKSSIEKGGKTRQSEEASFLPIDRYVIDEFSVLSGRQLEAMGTVRDLLFGSSVRQARIYV